MTRDCGEFALAGPTPESDGTGEVDVPADHDPKTVPGRLWPSNGVLSIPIGASKAFYDRPPSRGSRQHGRRRERRRNYAGDQPIRFADSRGVPTRSGLGSCASTILASWTRERSRSFENACLRW
jgi:hypothetical protein